MRVSFQRYVRIWMSLMSLRLRHRLSGSSGSMQRRSTMPMSCSASSSIPSRKSRIRYVHRSLVILIRDRVLTCQRPKVQLQTLTAVVKLYLQKPESSQGLVQKVLNTATKDCDSPDVRDRAYIYWRLLSTDPGAAKVG